MKIYFVFCLLWLSTMHLCEASGNEEENPEKSILYPALTIIYHRPEDRYMLADTRTIQEFNTAKPHDLEYSLVLLCCPDTFDETYVPPQPLHVRKVFKVNEDIDGVDICKHQYKPAYSILHRDIGYYISLTDESLITYNLSSLSKLTPYGENLPFIKVMHINTSLRHTSQTEHTFVAYRPEYYLGFAKSCKDYLKDVANLIDEDFSSFYEPKNQNEWLQNFHHPSSEYFVKHQLVPTDDFSDDSSRQVTCFDLNYTPIWKSISEGPIKIIEDYIRVVAKTVKVNTLTVTTKVLDSLMLQPADGTSPIKVYLDHNNGNTIPISQIFVKVLHYRLPYAAENGKSIRESPKFRDYYIAFVVHDQFEVSSQEKLCPIDICEQNNFPITTDEENRRLFYCCFFDDSFEMLNFNNIPIEIDHQGIITKDLKIPALE